MAPYAHIYEVYQNLKCTCAMLNWSGLVVSHPLLNDAYTEYGYRIRIRELIPCSKRFVFERQITRLCLVDDDFTSIFRSPSSPNLIS